MKRSFIFPGQGSQNIGMGSALLESYSEAREVFEEVNDALGQDLTKIILEGPEDQLNLTENTQPALMAVSLAVVAVLEKQGGFQLAEKCDFVAGHSLGEYSALTAAGSFSVSQAAKLLKIRGQAMQRAVPVGVGAMAAILGLDFEDVQDIAKQASSSEICEAANDNSVGQVVVSGHKGAVEAAIALAQEKGAKKAVSLPVSAPFHCQLMQPAADDMRQALLDTDMKDPAIAVVANVTAQAENKVDVLRDLLVKQVTGTVRWRESVIWMKSQGVEQMVELGAGKVLSGLARRIDRDISCISAETPEQIDALLEALS